MYTPIDKVYTPYYYYIPMTMTPEKRVKKRVVEILNDMGVYHFFPATYGMGRSGIPDIIGCIDGRFLAIECKAGTATTTALQLRELSRIQKAGGSTFVINEHTVEALSGYLKLITEGKYDQAREDYEEDYCPF